MKITKKKEEFPKYENVEVREVLVEDVIQAELVSEAKHGKKYEAALVAQIATFDGKKLTMEDIIKLPESFFFDIYDAAMNGEVKKLVDMFLSSASSQTSDQKAS